MTEQNSVMEMEKQEIAPEEGVERTRDCRCFAPRVDIYEAEDAIVVAADVPGATAETIDVTLEKNVLTIKAYVKPDEVENYALAWAEYQVGDFERSFTLSDEIDRDKIEASVKDGVLRLVLGKADIAKTRKIAVKAN